MTGGKQLEDAEARQSGELAAPPRWMLIAPLLVPGFVAGYILFRYFLQFPGGWSPDQAMWGHFGDFVGGVLNPVISWLGLIAVVISLYYNARASLPENNCGCTSRN
jgi:hypothetical protein